MEIRIEVKALGWVKSLFSKLHTQRIMIYATSDEADYMAMRSRLDAAGVHYILKNRRSNRYAGSEWSSFEIPTEYKFFVKAEDTGNAYKAMNRR
jgi:hypothetical protein